MSEFHDNMRLLNAMSFYVADPDDPEGKKSADTEFAKKLRREMIADYDALLADRDRLAAELDLARCEHRAETLVRKGLSTLLEQREAELSAARADAERYRFMKAEHDAGLYSVMDWIGPYPASEWDAAIDAARATPSAGAQYATGTDFRCPKCKGTGPCSECNPDPRAGLTVGGSTP